MKLSHITLGILILGASVMKGQEKPRPVKQDSIKTVKKTVGKPKPKLSKRDSLKTTKQKREIGPDYCPPCGMG